MSHSLEHMTHREAAAQLETAEVAIIPLGACEQHGPAMSLRTDTARADHVAQRVADNLNGKVVLTPTLPIGISEHHMALAGTVTFRPNTLELILIDIVDSLHRHGIRRFFFLTGHGGNLSTIDVAAVGLRRQFPDSLFAWSGITPVVADLLPRDPHSLMSGHCDANETSQAMYVDPDLVRTGQLARGTTALDELEGAALLGRSSPGFHLPVGYHQLNPSGGLGDPTVSTRERGETAIEAAVERIADFVERLAAVDIP